jgi:hypothetical protein
MSLEFSLTANALCFTFICGHGQGQDLDWRCTKKLKGEGG